MRRARTARSGALAATLALIGGCSDPEPIVIEITTGHESDTFSMDPAVTRVEILALDESGAPLSATSTEPGGAFSLGEIPIDQFLSFEVTGFDAGGDPRVKGRSLGLVVGALQSELFPVFAQRLMRWSRPPGGMPHSHRGGLATVLGERYLMLTAGEPVDAEAGDVAFYDLLALGGTAGGRLSFVPKSAVVAADASAILFIDDTRATWIDFDTGEPVDVAPPSQIGSWAQIAGGATIVTSEASYVVGGTRRDEPSDRILVVEPGRSIRGVAGVVERQGAAAAWIPDVGMAIAGGADEGPGVEVLYPEESATTSLDFGADPTTDAAAVAGNQSREAFLFCGQDPSGPAPPRAIDLGCSADCEPRILDVDLGLSLSDCEAFRLGGGRSLVVGSDEEGLVTSLVVDGAGAVQQLPLREPRKGATLTPTPNGALALIGGVHPDGTPALSVELLLPE